MLQRINQVWDRCSLRTKGLVMVATPLVVMLLPMALLYFNMQQRNEAQESVSQTVQVRVQIQEISAALSTAESEIRGYRLTGNKRHLMSYGNSRSALLDNLELFENLIAENAEQRKRLQRLRPIVSQRLKVMEAVGARAFEPLRPQPGLQAQMLLGAKLTAELKSVLHEMLAEEDRLFQQRSEYLSEVANRTQAIMLATVLIGLVSVLWAVFVFTSDILKRVQIIERNARLLADGWQPETHQLGSDELGRLERAIEATSMLLTENIRDLHASRQRLQALFNSSPDLLVFADDQGRLVDVNPAVKPLLGYEREELIGRSIGELTPLQFRDRWKSLWQNFEKALRQDGEITVACKNGGTIEVEYYAIASIEPGLHLGVLRDITGRKEAEEALRRSEERYRSLIEATTVIVWDTPPSGEFEKEQPGWTAFTGQSWNEIRGWGWLNAVHPDDREQTANVWSAAVRSKSLYLVEHRLRRQDGEYRHMMVRAAPIVDHDGAIREWIGVHTDISERKEIEVALRESHVAAELAREEAERANLAKSEFLSRMSHELRTPLNAILGFGQLLELDKLDADQLDSVAQILKAGRHLLALINEVLDIARIEEGRLTLSPEPVRVSEVAEEVLSLIQPLAVEVNVRLRDEIETEPPIYVQADRQRLKQVLLNLMANAVKYNVRGGEVILSCNPHGESSGLPDSTLQSAEILRICVRDTGPGISERDIQRLFAPFERLDEASSEVEGTGLGLALSKRLTELMNGEIGVESSAGKGSTFWVELPLLPNHQVFPEELEAADISEERTRRVKAHTILYIEDNLSNLKLIERILENDTEANLLSSMQGSIGLELARQHQPDLILLDLHLPDISGAEILQQLRADPLTNKIPVIMISADATDRQIERLIGLGARAYLTKPLDVRQFLAAVEEALEAANE